MAEIRFRLRVALVRALHWLGCRFPRSGSPAREQQDAEPPSGDPDLRIAPSLIPGAGLGAYARRPFEEGEVVCVYTGVRLSTLEALRTPDWRYLVGLGTNRAGKRVWVDSLPTPSVLARYVNHSFDPASRNIRTETLPDEERWVMRAGRPIAAGEELYCDYGRFHQHCFDRGLLLAAASASSGGGRPVQPARRPSAR